MELKPRQVFRYALYSMLYQHFDNRTPFSVSDARAAIEYSYSTEFHSLYLKAHNKGKKLFGQVYTKNMYEEYNNVSNWLNQLVDYEVAITGKPYSRVKRFYKLKGDPNAYKESYRPKRRTKQQIVGDINRRIWIQEQLQLQGVHSTAGPSSNPKELHPGVAPTIPKESGV